MTCLQRHFEVANAANLLPQLLRLLPLLLLLLLFPQQRTSLCSIPQLRLRAPAVKKQTQVICQDNKEWKAPKNSKPRRTLGNQFNEHFKRDKQFALSRSLSRAAVRLAKGNKVAAVDKFLIKF